MNTEHCRPTQERRAHSLADRLARLGTVEAVDVLGPTTGPRAGWTLEVTTTGAAAQPPLLCPIVETGASIPDVSPQGDHVRVTVGL